MDSGSSHILFPSSFEGHLTSFFQARASLNPVVGYHSLTSYCRITAQKTRKTGRATVTVSSPSFCISSDVKELKRGHQRQGCTTALVSYGRS